MNNEQLLEKLTKFIKESIDNNRYHMISRFMGYISKNKDEELFDWIIEQEFTDTIFQNYSYTFCIKLSKILLNDYEKYKKYASNILNRLISQKSSMSKEVFTKIMEIDDKFILEITNISLSSNYFDNVKFIYDLWTEGYKNILLKSSFFSVVFVNSAIDDFEKMYPLLKEMVNENELNAYVNKYIVETGYYPNHKKEKLAFIRLDEKDIPQPPDGVMLVEPPTKRMRTQDEDYELVERVKKVLKQVLSEETSS